MQVAAAQEAGQHEDLAEVKEQESQQAAALRAQKEKQEVLAKLKVGYYVYKVYVSVDLGRGSS